MRARCFSKSHRICQIRPSTKPIAIAIDISKTISSTKVIGMFLSGPCHYVAEQRLADRFAATSEIEQETAGEKGVQLLDRPGRREVVGCHMQEIIFGAAYLCLERE
jgi:hypothetical protein